MKASKFLKELEKVYKKAKELEHNYPSNSIWRDVSQQLGNIVDDVSSDMKVFGYD